VIVDMPNGTPSSSSTTAPSTTSSTPGN
jgi:hypothetical protein